MEFSSLLPISSSELGSQFGPKRDAKKDLPRAYEKEASHHLIDMSEGGWGTDDYLQPP